VNAPKEVAVHREEIYDRIKREQEASHVSGADSSAEDASDADSNYEDSQNSVAG